MTPREILALRRALGLTQQELADKIGAQRHTIARWELGRNQPRGANLKALLEFKARFDKQAKRRS